MRSVGPRASESTEGKEAEEGDVGDASPTCRGDARRSAAADSRPKDGILLEAPNTGVTPAAVSQHLRVLRTAGLVTGEKRGYYVHYRLNEKTLRRWRTEIDKLLESG